MHNALKSLIKSDRHGGRIKQAILEEIYYDGKAILNWIAEAVVAGILLWLVLYVLPNILMVY